MIEDFAPISTQLLSSVALQFLVFVVSSTESCFQMPIFVPPTLPNGLCVAVAPNTTFSSQVTANSGDSDATIVEIQTTSPLGAVKGEVQNVLGSSNYFVNITWTPLESQFYQSHLLCYIAVNSGGLASMQSCLELQPGIFPPMPIPQTAIPNHVLVHPSNTTWKISFDSNITRSSINAFVTFHEFGTNEEVYKIDSSLSSEFLFETSTTITIKPAYVFAEKKSFYINLDRNVVEGIQGCGPGNEPVINKTFWTFMTMDVTSPTIKFLDSPSVSNSNITLFWESNENVTWDCILVMKETAKQVVVECSEAYWEGYNLDAGFYKLEVLATDEGGNVALATQEFLVDLTPPVVSIVQKPNPISNRQTVTFEFLCNEICSFQCQFMISNASKGNFSLCNGGTFTTSSLQHNHKYTFQVIATDQVGNVGQSATYTWETDFKSPEIFGINDTIVLCTETDPVFTGQPQATDDTSSVISLTYHDVQIAMGCSIRRTWHATDMGGNTAHLVQIINIEWFPTLTLAQQLSIPCDSTKNTVEVPSNTATAYNPCHLPLQLIHMDSVTEYTCDSEFSRNWTATVCQRSASALQHIVLYDVCPPHACGRNESSPHGLCFMGECNCYTPWHGVDCRDKIYAPVPLPVSDTVLKETQHYTTTLGLSQGTPPLSWMLLSGPPQLTLNEASGHVDWIRSQAGIHRILVQVKNEVGVANVNWTLSVSRGYDAFLNTTLLPVLPYVQPVELTGYVEYTAENLAKDSLVCIVPVDIDIKSNGTVRTLTILTNKDGSFSKVFYPALSEYGSYTAGARHPSLPDAPVQTEWKFLGMRATPNNFLLKGETLDSFQNTFHNATVICNDGPAPINGLVAVTPTINSEDIDIQISVLGLPSNNVLEPGRKAWISVTVSAKKPLYVTFPFQLRSMEATTVHIVMNIEIEQILPSFFISPNSVNARILRGKPNVFEFTVTNVGRSTANNVRPLLPASSVFSFISFGSISDEQSLNLNNGESAKLSILVQTEANHPLGVITASIGVVSDEVSKHIPVSLTVSSNISMNFSVIVEDEYTYFASGAPLVDDATVTLVNYQRSVVLTKTTKITNGTAVFVEILEDQYEMIIEAPNHRTLTQVIITSETTPVLTVFIQRQAVTYTWSVTPVAFDDTYIISIEADFETRVPIPVVTVTPNDLDLEELENGFISSFQINITNHGLIRANDVNIEFPNDHPFLSFSTNAEDIGDLEPLSSIITTVQISRKITEKRATLKTVQWIVYLIKIGYSYVCGEVQFQTIPITLKKREVKYVSVDNQPTPIVCSNCGFVGGIDGTSGFGRFSFNGFSAKTPAFCNKCLQSVLSCVPDPDLPFSGCIPLIASGTNPLSSVNNALEWVQCALDGLGVNFQWLGRRAGTTPTAKKSKSSKLETLGKYIDRGLNIKDCILDVYENCLSSLLSKRKKRSLASRVSELADAMYAVHLSIALGFEVLGDQDWFFVGNPMWLSNVLQPATDDASESGAVITENELAAVLSLPPPDGISVKQVEMLVDRLNNTIIGWNSGILEAGDEASNIASYNNVLSLLEEISTYNEKAITKGFTSYLDAYNFARSDINQIATWEEEGGVCAVVRIRIEQELAITREAFLARLEIDNQEDSPLEQMEMEIEIFNQLTGDLSTSLFSVGNETLHSSLERVGNKWLLPSAMSGAVEWLIVPYSEAAPDSNRLYYVQGTLRYILDSENISIPLLPTVITVMPDSSLHVNYFWEKYVIGDNPFTEEIEPSVPFTLAVVVQNLGHGTARDLRITSGQPEIIDNEKGLLVNFMIIGASIANEEIQPSLSVSLGDVPFNTTKIVRWSLISSLQGEFKNYSATFENKNPLGDPKLSILNELGIHQLIRNVEIYTEEDDGILDFLVSKFGKYPDTLYSSINLKQYNVSAGEVNSVTFTALSVEVNTSSNYSGWIYYRYEDNQNHITMTADTVFLRKQRDGSDDGIVFVPSINSWITKTQMNDGEREMYTIHILDHLQAKGEVMYTMQLCRSNCSTVEIPYNPPPVAEPSTSTPNATTLPTMQGTTPTSSTSQATTAEISSTQKTTPTPIPEDPLKVYFINDSPKVNGRTVIIYVDTNKPADIITCQLTRTGLPEQNCSSGIAVFTDVPAGVAVARVEANAGSETTIERIRLKISSIEGFCFIHYINTKVTNDVGSTTIHFGSSGNPTGYNCELDGIAFSCMSPLTAYGYKSGRHRLVITPLGCKDSESSVFRFIVP